MPMIDIYKPPVSYKQAQQEVDEAPPPADASGMKIVLGPPTHETALPGEYSPMFEPRRFVLAIGAFAVMNVPNIPRSWAVFVNGNSAVGALVQVQAGGFDVTLGVGQSVIFPGRTPTVQITCTVAASEVTVVALGDDRLRF